MERILDRRVRDFSKQSDVVQSILIHLIALLVPTFLGGILKSVFAETSFVAMNSQIIIGSIVNTALIWAALNLKGWQKIVGIVTMPSISTMLSGYVFKSASPFMVYMIPAIWLGNFALIYAYKALLTEKKGSYIVAAVAGVVTKVLVIAAGFMLLKSLNVFPDKMVGTLQIAMTSTQLLTATIGAVMGFGIYETQKHVLKNK